MKLELVVGDDWEGLYVDGRLACEGHSVTLQDLARVVGLQLVCSDVDGQWLDDQGQLPELLSEIPEKVRTP